MKPLPSMKRARGSKRQPIDGMPAMPPLPRLQLRDAAGTAIIEGNACMIGTGAREYGAGKQGCREREQVSAATALGPMKAIEANGRPVRASKTDLTIDLGPRYERQFEDGLKMVVINGQAYWRPAGN